MDCDNKTHLVEFEDNAANAPHITWLRPAQLQDDLGRSVVSGADHAGVVLPVKRGGAEVNQLDPGVSHPPDVLLGRGTILREPVIGHKQNVLRLQISVGQMIVVKKLK